MRSNCSGDNNLSFISLGYNCKLVEFIKSSSLPFVGQENFYYFIIKAYFLIDIVPVLAILKFHNKHLNFALGDLSYLVDKNSNVVSKGKAYIGNWR